MNFSKIALLVSLVVISSLAHSDALDTASDFEYSIVGMIIIGIAALAAGRRYLASQS